MIALATIRRAWCAETSYWPDRWSPENPALGQCAVTAMLIQDDRGGLILRSENRGDVHYWNALPYRYLDLTAGQFARPVKRLPFKVVRRATLDANPDTLRRYQLLKSRVAA